MFSSISLSLHIHGSLETARTGFLSTTFDLAILTEVRCLLEALAAPRQTVNGKWQKSGFRSWVFVKQAHVKANEKYDVYAIYTYMYIYIYITCYIIISGSHHDDDNETDDDDNHDHDDDRYG